MTYKILNHYTVNDYVYILDIETYAIRRGDEFFRSEVILPDILYNKLSPMTGLTIYHKYNYYFDIDSNKWMDNNNLFINTLHPKSKYKKYSLKESIISIECSKKVLSKLLLSL